MVNTRDKNMKMKEKQGVSYEHGASEKQTTNISVSSYLHAMPNILKKMKQFNVEPK